MHPWRLEHCRGTLGALPHPGRSSSAPTHYPTHAQAMSAAARMFGDECRQWPVTYGVQLGVDSPDTGRVCVLEVGGFEHLEEVFTFAESARGLPASQVARSRGARDRTVDLGYDGTEEDQSREVAGATVFAYDDWHGTLWGYDLTGPAWSGDEKTPGEWPVYGAELTVNRPEGGRICVLDVRGFPSEATADTFGHRTLGRTVEDVAADARKLGFRVDLWDATGEDMRLPVIGGGVYCEDAPTTTLWEGKPFSEPTVTA